jgi:hypothetical protein
MKKIMTIILMLTLSGCSGGPSSYDIKQHLEQRMMNSLDSRIRKDSFISDLTKVNGYKDSGHSYINVISYTIVSIDGQKTAIREQIRSIDTENGWAIDDDYSTDGFRYSSSQHIDEVRNHEFEKYNEGHTCSFFNQHTTHDTLHDTQSILPITSGPTNPDSGYELMNNGSEVRDIQTELIWQRCSLGQHWNGNNCAGTAIKYSWQQAKEAAKAAGPSWRLPDIYELQSLLEMRCAHPAINTTIFPATQLSEYLTTTEPSQGTAGLLREESLLSVDFNEYLREYRTDDSWFWFARKNKSDAYVRLVRDTVQ